MMDSPHVNQAHTNIVGYAEPIFLATPAVVAYFEAREHEAYYRALKNNEQRREFHGRFICILEEFIELTNFADGAKAVDKVMATRAVHSPQSTTKSPLAKARAQCPNGVELLAVQEPITFESLKEAFRAAARRHHPDTGGSHEAMTAVNQAFTVLHELLCAKLAIDQGEYGKTGAAPRAHGVDVVLYTHDDATDVGSSDDQIETCADYRYNCGELLFRVLLDDWGVDFAAAWLEKITSPVWQMSLYARQEKQRLALAWPAGRLAERLAITGRIGEARNAFAVARDSVRLAARKGLRYEQYLQGAEAVFSGSKRWRVVIGHPRQAENARRLNVIDEKQYKKALEKHAAAADQRKSSEQRLREFQKSRGFVSDLPTDKDAIGKTVGGSLIPDPDYGMVRISYLTDDQQAEYCCAFSSVGSLALGRKYLFVRLVSLLESVLLFPHCIDAGRAFDEATFLEALHDVSHYNVATTIHALAEQSINERKSRAALVAAIEEARPNPPGYVVIGGLGSPLSMEYMRSILRPIIDLEVMLRRGRFPEIAAERRDTAISSCESFRSRGARCYDDG